MERGFKNLYLILLGEEGEEYELFLHKTTSLFLHNFYIVSLKLI